MIILIIPISISDARKFFSLGVTGDRGELGAHYRFSARFGDSKKINTNKNKFTKSVNYSKIYTLYYNCLIILYWGVFFLFTPLKMYANEGISTKRKAYKL